MNDKLRQQHFKTNAPVDTDDFLNKLYHRIDSESSNKRKAGIGFTTLTVVIFLYMFVPMETISYNKNFYTEIDYLEDSKISGLLTKYCKFLPVDIKFGTNTKKEKNDKDEEIEMGFKSI